jgi:hypothetical protein
MALVILSGAMQAVKRMPKAWCYARSGHRGHGGMTAHCWLVVKQSKSIMQVRVLPLQVGREGVGGQRQHQPRARLAGCRNGANAAEGSCCIPHVQAELHSGGGHAH